MYLTFAGLSIDQLLEAGGAGAKLLDAYKAKYGKAPSASYAAVRRGRGAGHPGGDREVRRHPQGRHRRGLQRRAASRSRPTESVIGKEIKIDPATGDTNAKDITV